VHFFSFRSLHNSAAVSRESRNGDERTGTEIVCVIDPSASDGES
jgi:hypothetical protein